MAKFESYTISDWPNPMVLGVEPIRGLTAFKFKKKKKCKKIQN